MNSLKPYRYIESRNFKKLYFDLMNKLIKAKDFSMTRKYLIYLIDKEKEKLEKYTRTKNKQTRIKDHENKMHRL